MKTNKLKPLLLVGCLLTITCAAIVYASKVHPFGSWSPPLRPAKDGVVSLSGNITQNKVLFGGDGLATLSLSLTASEVLDPDKGDVQNVDMVIVLDRSGSMGGEKIADARQAALNLLSNLSAEDRLNSQPQSGPVNNRVSNSRIFQNQTAIISHTRPSPHQQDRVPSGPWRHPESWGHHHARRGFFERG